MRLTGIGKFLILILAIGIAIGGWRLWQQKNGGASNFLVRFIPGNNDPNKNTTPNGTPNTTPGVADNEILFVITPAKKGWVQDQIKSFNAAQNGKYKIVTTSYPSREGMHAILTGKIKPVLWSPGSPMWPTRLAQFWKASYSTTLLDMSNPNSHRAFLRSPLVFLTTKQKAKFLRPLLGGPQAWSNLRDLSMRRRRTPWGNFKFSHADPLTSSSGMMTLGLILYDYGQRTNQAGNLDRVAKQDPKFFAYLRELEKSLVYDKPAEEGTTALTKAFVADTSRYDVITAYESAALAAAANNSELAVIYPSPTAVSEHAVTLLDGKWITPTQREGALAFIAFLGGREPLADGLKEHFRPAQSGSDLSLAPELSQRAAQGFQQSYSSIELPSYVALNNAAFQWRIKIAGKPVS